MAVEGRCPRLSAFARPAPETRASGGARSVRRAGAGGEVGETRSEAVDLAGEPGGGAETSAGGERGDPVLDGVGERERVADAGPAAAPARSNPVHPTLEPFDLAHEPGGAVP